MKNNLTHWFTADTHFGHGNIIKYCNRPFMSNEERQLMDEAKASAEYEGQFDKVDVKHIRISKESIDWMDTTIIDNINTLVQPNDILWHLGDFAFVKFFDQAKRYRDRIHCKTINFIWGNHDRADIIRPLFNMAWDQVTMEFRDVMAVLNHYAMAVWDQSHRNSIMLYGHSHGTHENWREEHMPDRRTFDVGVDCWNFQPLSLEQIMKIMDKKKAIVNTAPKEEH